MHKREIKKLYYSISDVSKMADIKQHVLRYWESEFPELHPAKNRAGNRIYRLKDIKLVFLLKKLLYEEKYTIEGAKRKLKEILAADKNLEFVEEPTDQKGFRELITSVKDDLLELKSLLEF